MCARVGATAEDDYLTKHSAQRFACRRLRQWFGIRRECLCHGFEDEPRPGVGSFQVPVVVCG